MQAGIDTHQASIDADDRSVFVVDREFRYAAFNKAHGEIMRALCGAEISLGERFTDFLTAPADRETALANLERALAGEIIAVSVFSDQKDGRRSFDVVHTPITDAGGTVVGVIVHAIDTTERRRRVHPRMPAASRGHL